MPDIATIDGTLEAGRIVTLDQPLPIKNGRIRLIVERIVPTPPMTPEAFEKMLRDRQQARGHVPRTQEEIEAYLSAERASWDD